MGIQRTLTAFSYSLPENRIGNLLGRTVAFPGIAATVTLQRLGVLHSVNDVRRDLNDPNVFGSDAKRLYLYSTADEVVRWQDVEAHVTDARARGLRVDAVKFERGAHCALVVEDDTRYTEIVKAFGMDALTAGTNKSARPSGSSQDRRIPTEQPPPSLRSKL